MKRNTGHLAELLLMTSDARRGTSFRLGMATYASSLVLAAMHRRIKRYLSHRARLHLMEMACVALVVLAVVVALRAV